MWRGGRFGDDYGLIKMSQTQLTLIPGHHHCVFKNQRVYRVENEHRGARVDAWQLGRVRDDSGLH